VQRAVHLVGRDVVEQVVGQVVLPGPAGGVEQVGRAHHVGEHERERIGDGAVHVRLGRQVDHAVEAVFGKQPVHESGVHDVAFEKSIIGGLLNVSEVGEVTGVGQLVEVKNVVVGMPVYEQPYYVGTDEPGPAGNQNFLHSINIRIYRINGLAGLRIRIRRITRINKILSS
jgi:hypothetical protein